MFTSELTIWPVGCLSCAEWQNFSSEFAVGASAWAIAAFSGKISILFWLKECCDPISWYASLPELFTSSFSTCSRILNDEPSNLNWNRCPIDTTTCIDCGHRLPGPMFHRVTTKVWSCEAVPNNWSETVLLPLLRKTVKPICSKYRGIS